MINIRGMGYHFLTVQYYSEHIAKICMIMTPVMGETTNFIP